MNDINFCNSFIFNIFRFRKYHFSDLSKTPVPRHYFGCLIKGNVIIKSQQQELRLGVGEVFYIPKGLHYQSQWFGDEIEFYSFGFEIAPTSKAFLLQKVDCSEEERALFAALCEEVPFTEKGIGKLYHFFGEVSDKMLQDKKAYRNPTLDWATAYITDNPNAKISDIAKHCNISESGLYALFKKQTGKTPNDFRLEVLCDKAIEMLSTTNKSVQEVSDETGFSSTSYFRKILRKYKGKTPLQIRKESAF